MSAVARRAIGSSDEASAQVVAPVETRSNTKVGAGVIFAIVWIAIISVMLIGAVMALFVQ